jgi:DNA-binding transcriptional ArsR family regulator
MPPTPADPRTNAQALEASRVRRAELHESMSALEQALAAPTRGRVDAWAERVHVALVELARDFREHVFIAEGQGGVYPEVLTTAPRLSDEVARLTRDHVAISLLLDDLLKGVSGELTPAGVGRVRELGTQLLVRLTRSRQGSGDLVYEASQSDIGGES